MRGDDPPRAPAGTPRRPEAGRELTRETALPRCQAAATARATDGPVREPRALARRELSAARLLTIDLPVPLTTLAKVPRDPSRVSLQARHAPGPALRVRPRNKHDEEAWPRRAGGRGPGAGPPSMTSAQAGAEHCCPGGTGKKAEAGPPRSLRTCPRTAGGTHKPGSPTSRGAPALAFKETGKPTSQLARDSL